ncbi:MAG: hypothetical protein HXY38_15120, partial [Chloroflexi bacterium]|nr:hypothetical protein [Chloroflexota bacterium]
MSSTLSTDQPQPIPPLLKARWFWLALIGLALVLGSGWIVFSRTLLGGTASGGEEAVLEPAPVKG